MLVILTLYLHTRCSASSSSSLYVYTQQTSLNHQINEKIMSFKLRSIYIYDSGAITLYTKVHTHTLCPGTMKKLGKLRLNHLAYYVRGARSRLLVYILCVWLLLLDTRCVYLGHHISILLLMYICVWRLWNFLNLNCYSMTMQSSSL